MKLYTFIRNLLAIQLLLLGSNVAYAAYNTVTLGSGTAVISIGGVLFNVSGSNSLIESITVGSSNFTAIMQQNSTLTVTSPTNNAISTLNLGAVTSSITCSATDSTVILTNNTADAITVTLSPSTFVCGSPTSLPSGGGGGGGGYTAPPPVVAHTIPVVVANTPAVVSAQSSVNQNTTFVQAGSAVTKSLRKGMMNPEVKWLQIVLNSDPTTQITKSGAGSPGKETELFGSLTLSALKKFQVKYNISSPGQSGYGTLGPKTRAKVNEILKSMSSGSSMTAPQPQDNSQQIQDMLNKIKALQLQLQTAH